MLYVCESKVLWSNLCVVKSSKVVNLFDCCVVCRLPLIKQEVSRRFAAVRATGRWFSRPPPTLPSNPPKPKLQKIVYIFIEIRKQCFSSSQQSDAPITVYIHTTRNGIK